MTILVFSNIVCYNLYDDLIIKYNSLVKEHNFIVADNQFLESSYNLIAANLTWVNEGKYIRGYAVNADFYCVVTNGLDNDEIASIDVHEKCHILVYNDHEHFCNN